MYRFVYYIDPVLFFQARQTRQTDRHTDRQDRQTDKTGRQDRQTRQMDRWMDKTDRQTAIERAGWSWPF